MWVIIDSLLTLGHLSFNLLKIIHLCWSYIHQPQQHMHPWHHCAYVCKQHHYTCEWHSSSQQVPHKLPLWQGSWALIFSALLFSERTLVSHVGCYPNTVFSPPPSPPSFPNKLTFIYCVYRMHLHVLMMTLTLLWPLINQEWNTVMMFPLPWFIFCLIFKSLMGQMMALEWKTWAQAPKDRAVEVKVRLWVKFYVVTHW